MANALTTQVSDAVRQLSGPRRLIAIATSAVGVILLFAVSWWASTPKWITLYQNVPLADAAAMKDALDKAAIRNDLGADGSEIRVSSEKDVARARVLLAKDGLPQNGQKGWRIFDGESGIWGRTEFDQRVTYQRALEGELANTITGLDGVQHAEVHLAIPATNTFRRNEKPPKAVVVVRMKPGRQLPAGAIQGITFIVSNSIEGMSSDNVALMDDAGRVLSSPSEGSSVAGMTTRQIDIQHAVEKSLIAKAEEGLASVGGIGHPKVQVSADLNFDQVERTIQTFDPDGQVLSNEARSETKGGADAAAGSGDQTVINNSYQNAGRLEKIVTAVGTVRHLTVAVMLDERAVRADSANTQTPEARRANVELFVRNALGIDSTRGDRLSVGMVPFEEPVTTPVDEVKPKSDPFALVERFLRPAVGLVGMIAMLIVAMRVTKSSGRRGSNEAFAMAGARQAMQMPATTELPPLGPPPEAVLLKNQVLAESNGRPELTVQVVRAWLGE